jgi:hypothetical protein
MNAMSIRRDSRSPAPPEGSEGRHARTFLCRDDLYRAFEGRARELECSVDWLLGEAMKRLLADATLAKIAPPRPPTPSVGPPPLPPPPALRSLRPLGPPLVPPPPPPPRSRKATGSFVGEKAGGERIALRVGDLRVVVDRDRFVIGRSARDAQLPLRDGGVSRQHAMIERVPGESRWAVVDMASTNGVEVNGVRVTRAALRPGDTITIGGFRIAVERA